MTKKKALIFSSFIIIAIGSFRPVSADAQEYSCQIKAERDNYHLFVRDFDRDGNPTRRIIFRGWILRGQDNRSSKVFPAPSASTLKRILPSVDQEAMNIDAGGIRRSNYNRNF